MAIITISREFGSEGTLIAAQVAQTLGYHLVDKGIMEWVLHQYGLVRAEEANEAPTSFWSRFDWQLLLTADMLERTIKALAQHGNVVITGRGGYAVLGGLADVLKVRVQAPVPVRVHRVMASEGIGLLEAEARVAEEDRTRAGFLERVYGVRSDDARAFDLVIDTGSISPELATRWIIEANRALSDRGLGDAPTAATLKVSSTLARVICDALGCESNHR